MALAIGYPSMVAGDAEAQDTAIPDAGRRTVSVGRAVEAPNVDGLLHDTAWDDADALGGFVQRRPLEGENASDPTEVRLVYDATTLYVAIRATYARPGIAHSNLADRDDMWEDDTVRLYFDPFLDQQRAYVFAVNAFGVQGDALITASGGGRGGGDGDRSWDAVFRSEAARLENGWSAELAIPFSSLRYPPRGPGEVHRWGFQIERTVEGRNERTVWSPVTRDIPGLLRQLGTLTGLADLSTSRSLDLQPTVSMVRVDQQPLGEPLASDTTREAGLNARYALTSDLGVSATVNPDFSQVESDQPRIVTNQRFPFFDAERRPFFLEGQEVFAVGGPATAVHTRTIVDPDFGLKVAGRIGRTMVGVLAANDAAPGRTENPTEPGAGESALAFIARGRVEVAPDSTVGAIATHRTFADTSSRLAGVDTALQLSESVRLTASWLRSTRTDDAGTRRGVSYELQLDRMARNWRYQIGHSNVDPDFGSDLGFVRRTDVRRTGLRLGYRWWPEHWLSNWEPRVEADYLTTSSGAFISRSAGAGARLQFAGTLRAGGMVTRDEERINGWTLPRTRIQADASTDVTRALAVSTLVETGDEILFGDRPFVGHGTTLSATIVARLFSRLRTEWRLSRTNFLDTRVTPHEVVFDDRVLRARTTYQLTPRWQVRHVGSYNTSDHSLSHNVLATYRLNAGTDFIAGYDGRHEQLLPGTGRARAAWQPTSRAVFARLQVLIRR